MDESAKISLQLIEEFITRLGFPIAVAVFFMIKDFLRERKQNKKVTDILNNIMLIHEQDAESSKQTIQLIQSMQTQLQTMQTQIVQMHTWMNILITQRTGGG